MSDDKVEKWEYSDDIALMVKAIEALSVRAGLLEQALTSQALVLAELRAAVERVAEYQGVKHLLSPQ